MHLQMASSVSALSSELLTSCSTTVEKVESAANFIIMWQIRLTKGFISLLLYLGLPRFASLLKVYLISDQQEQFPKIKKKKPTLENEKNVRFNFRNQFNAVTTSNILIADICSHNQGRI